MFLGTLTRIPGSVTPGIYPTCYLPTPRLLIKGAVEWECLLNIWTIFEFSSRSPNRGIA